jgi:gamma-glutamyltranspeptidase/glutathione hydrolase
MNRFLPILITFVVLSSCQSGSESSKLSFDPYHYSISKDTIVSKAAVVSAHPLATKAGISILQKGGNAVDAAIAVQLALAVVYPGAGNIGGGGFMVARLSDGKLVTIDYREKAPGRGGRDMYIDSSGAARSDWSQDGHLAAGVPGTVAGLFAASKYGKLSFAELIAPAIELAENGFVLLESEAGSLNYLQEDLKKFNTVQPVFVRDQPWKAGDTLVQKELAATLRRISEKGAAGFYEGETARLIVAEMERGKGLISLEDLKNYKAVERPAHTFKYKDYEIVGMPMPSSGGLLLNQMMKMVEKKDIAQLGFQTPASVQLMIEAERRAYADRAEYMGDADFFPVPVKELSAEAYLEQRMKDFTPGIAGNSNMVNPGKVPMPESEETTHLSVVDADGNAVAVTTTLNGGYGSRTVVGGAGFFLNNEMDDFSIKPGVPNMYGAVGGEANAIKPGKRMLSSMTPTIVLKNNNPYLVTGTPGGTTIPTSVYQTLLNIIEFDLSAVDAVNLPKFHHQWRPDTVFIEQGFRDSTRIALEKMGYKLLSRGQIGRTELIRILPDGKIEAVADRRGDDHAEGL